MILELPTELESQIERAARRRGTDARAFIIEATRAAIEATPNGAADDNATQARNATTAQRQAPALSPMARALAMKPVKSSGPVDAVADLEELRATRAEELAG